MNDVLFFKEPPYTWEHYLPLGNGRIGAMVHAHPCNEIIQLNEEGIWSGGPHDRVNPDSQKYLPQIRQLVKEGRVMQAQELAFQTLSGTCFNERVYQTAGDFKIDFFDEKNAGLECGWPLEHKTPEICIKSYEAELNLSEACTTVTYTNEEGVTFTRKTWISAVDDMLFMHVTASEKGKINFSGYLDRGIWVDKIFSENDFIFLEDSHGIPFTVGAGCVTSGGISGTKGFCLDGRNCDEVLFFIDIQAFRWNKKPISKKEYDKLILKNSWTKECSSRLEKTRQFILSHGISVATEDIFGWHLAEYSGYWDRFKIEIGKTVYKEEGDVKKLADEIGAEHKFKTADKIPTPELLKKAKVENTDFINLYANFSRYLLISASRVPGELPTTLQGLWNCYMDPPWGSKYTININTEMNYWPVNMAGLSECELPLFELLERAYINGVDVAKRMYNCRGYVIHHNTDYWGDAAPQDSWLPGTYWTLGGAWLSTHIWEHYEYTMDVKFLERYYYLLHEACLFFVDFLQPCDIMAPDGKPYLVINPSLSPENSYATKAGQVGAFCEGCEMDNMILEHLFKSCLLAKKVLQKSSCKNKKGKLYPVTDFEAFENVLTHLKKPEMNSDGSLMEWNTEVPEVEPGHRHISHLYGLYPGHTITVEQTPELAGACIKTLEKRLKNGGGHTGWSQSWIINFRAQLEQGNEAANAIETLLTHSTLPNLLDNHPPFQIDGNFGSFAAIMRLFVQSEILDDGTVYVKLLPALPSNKKWQNGKICGIKIKGGYTASFEWLNGKTCNVMLEKNTENAIKFIKVMENKTDITGEVVFK